jgi:hypothetical protein
MASVQVTPQSERTYARADASPGVVSLVIRLPEVAA